MKLILFNAKRAKMCYNISKSYQGSFQLWKEKKMEKRRDLKGRILNKGESQRKDGRYAFKYRDAFGKVQFAYSWKLTATDRVPKGKRDCISLREQESEIQKDLSDGIDTNGKKMTLCELYKKQNASRANVKKSTLLGRQRLMRALEQDILGLRSIDSIKPSDAKEWAVRMKANGYAYKTINNYKRSLKAAFYIAIQDDYVRKNPFDYKMSDVIADDSKPREALTEDEEKKLLAFAKTDMIYKKYYDVIVILLNTGLRISELCGLTVNDLDFEKRLIHVNHQLLKDSEHGYYIDTPKTKSGVRQVPMNQTAYEAFKHVLKQCEGIQSDIIDGYSDFLFLTQEGHPVIAQYYSATFRNLVTKYNKTHEDELPYFSPHVLRHTFCTRLAGKNMNPKSLQYIMGHSSIEITLNLYAHVTIDGIQAEMERLAE